MNRQANNPMDDNPMEGGIRKAAILVAGLDRATADSVLEQLAPEQAQQVRRLLVDLEKIDPKEERRVIEEFFRVRPMMPRQDPPGIELDGRLARKLSMSPTHAAADARQSPPPSDSRPFHFLREAEAEKLARVLADERPQTIALVLSHLPPDRAGGVLARLEPALQTDVIHRLIDLEETHPEILGEVERALQTRLSQLVHIGRRRVVGTEAVAGILEACDSRAAVEILDNLAAHDQVLAEKLSGPALKFDDLAQLDDATLGAVFHAADPKLAMTALIGAPPALTDRILRRFPLAEAEAVRHKLDHPGPIRLSDMEDARQRIADLARRLAMEGRIELPQHAYQKTRIPEHVGWVECSETHAN